MDEHQKHWLGTPEWTEKEAGPNKIDLSNIFFALMMLGLCGVIVDGK